MRIIEQSGVSIAAVSGCTGHSIVDNQEALYDLYGSDAAKIIRSTGIKSRSVVAKGTSTLELCMPAAKEILGALNYNPDMLAGIVSVSFTSDYRVPGNSTLAQAALGATKETVCIDLQAHCAGYPYGLWVASSLTKALGGDVLLLCGDVQSNLISSLDKATYPLFGDAGSATLLLSNGDDLWRFSFFSDGSRAKALQIPAGGSAHPLTFGDVLPKLQSDGETRRNIDFAMDGMTTYKFVASDVYAFLRDYLKASQLKPEDYAAFVPHQANMYIIRQLAAKLGFTEEQTWRSGDTFGNTAAASIPLSIVLNLVADECADKEEPNQPKRCLLAGFGGGLSAAIADIPLYSNNYYGLRGL